MKQVVIENPILNSPFEEPQRHFRFSEEGITNEIVEGRRTSSYFIPIARPRKKNEKQREFETEWTQDRIEENIRYVKNHNLGFTIPYTLNGEGHQYIRDFIACIDDGHCPDDLLNLLVEVTGEKKKDKAAKVATARTLWVPAVNNHGGFGRWAFIEIDDPWDAQNTIQASLRLGREQPVAFKSQYL